MQGFLVIPSYAPCILRSLLMTEQFQSETESVGADGSFGKRAISLDITDLNIVYLHRSVSRRLLIIFTRKIIHVNLDDLLVRKCPIIFKIMLLCRFFATIKCCLY